MNPCDQLLIEQLSSSNKDLLWICDENINTQLIKQVNPHSTKTITNRYTIHQQLDLRGFNSCLNDFDFSKIGQFNNIIFRVSKERSLAQHCILQAWQHLAMNGNLTLIGEKNDGLKTHSKFAEKVFNNKAKLQKRGLAYSACLTKTSDCATEDLEKSPYQQLQAIEHNAYSFYSKPGIYGWKKADLGSQLLIAAFKNALSDKVDRNRKVLDLGCGYGFLTLEAAKLGFKHLSATDNNAAAITAAEKNFSEHALAVNLSLDDCAQNITEQFDYILCNPPFHQGFDHDKSLTQLFVNQCAKLLKRSGSAYFVVNEFISLAAGAKESKLNAECLESQKGFKVFKLTH